MFNDWLLSKLREKDWEQADLARASGLTTAAISKYIGGRVPNAGALKKIAHALEVPIDVVLEKAGILPPKTELSPKKRELLHLAEQADDETVELILDILRSAAARRRRQVPTTGQLKKA